MQEKNDALKQAEKERDYLASMLADHCKAQDSGVYEADGYYCRAFKMKCPFPFRECADVTPAMWLEKAK